MRLDINRLIENCNEFYYETKNTPNSRSLSWEHCYNLFNQIHEEKLANKNIMIDYEKLCINLAFYLASWGMYRGSSFLLQRDYMIHKPIFKELLKEKYNNLWNIKCIDYISNPQNLELLIELSNKISKLYLQIKKEIVETADEISKKLITKILLGTMGCVPAYDTYFMSSIKNLQIAMGTFNNKSILQLAEFYQENYEAFENIRKSMTTRNRKYPQMKILDMALVIEGSKGKNIKVLK